MATDAFLDLLSPMARQGYSGADSPSLKRSRVGRLAIDTRKGPSPVPAAVAPISDIPATNVRPDFADDIDRIVCELEADGLIVFDGETQSYRRPNVRRWRFA